MNRAQRRAAERQARRNPAATRHGTPAQPRPASQQPAPLQDYAAFVDELNVPADGIGVDLQYVTDEYARLRGFSTSTNYHVREVERRRTFARQWDTPDMAGIIKRGAKAERAGWGKTGVFCERSMCGRMEKASSIDGTVPSMKRCSQCLQVYYCGAQCQKEDWSHHKQFCEVAGPHHPPKDALLQILRSVPTNPFLMPLLKIYIRGALNLDNEPLAATHSLLRFSCGLASDPVRKSKYMLQIGQVYVIPGMDMKTDNTPPDDATARRRLMSGQWELRTPVSFTFALPGLSARQYVMIGLERALFAEMTPPPQPILSLAMLNQFIRDDIDNVFKLRVPKSWFPPFETWPSSRKQSSESSSDLSLERLSLDAPNGGASDEPDEGLNSQNDVVPEI